MKNTNLTLNIIFAIAIVALFILHFTSRKSSDVVRTGIVSTDSVAVLPVAYVNVDSLLSNYYFSRDLNEQMLRKTETAQATINQQGRALEADMKEFQRKVENNAFFDRARAEKEQQRILKRQQDFQQLNQKLTLELQKKQEETNRILRDTIMSQLKSFNAERHYQIIFSNAMNDNILYAEDAYDITNELVTYLNKKYVPAIKEAE